MVYAKSLANEQMKIMLLEEDCAHCMFCTSLESASLLKDLSNVGVKFQKSSWSNAEWQFGILIRVEVITIVMGSDRCDCNGRFCWQLLTSAEAQFWWKTVVLKLRLKSWERLLLCAEWKPVFRKILVLLSIQNIAILTVYLHMCCFMCCADILARELARFTSSQMEIPSVRKLLHES